MCLLDHHLAQESLEGGPEWTLGQGSVHQHSQGVSSGVRVGP